MQEAVSNKVETPDFVPQVASLDDVLKEISESIEKEDMAQFKELAKGTMVKIKEAKKLVRIYEATLAKDYQAFKDGIL